MLNLLMQMLNVEFSADKCWRVCPEKLQAESAEKSGSNANGSAGRIWCKI